MASEWEMAMGMIFGLGMGASYNSTSSTKSAAVAALAPFASDDSPAYHHHYGALPSIDTLQIDDLLDFSANHDTTQQLVNATTNTTGNQFVGAPAVHNYTAPGSCHSVPGVLSFYHTGRRKTLGFCLESLLDCSFTF